MRDPCKAGLWDIQPEQTCPVCGALPDTKCLGRPTTTDDRETLWLSRYWLQFARLKIRQLPQTHPAVRCTVTEIEDQIETLTTEYEGMREEQTELALGSAA